MVELGTPTSAGGSARAAPPVAEAAPPAVEAAPPPMGGASRLLLERLRLLAAEALDLREALRSIREGEAELERYAAYLVTTRSQMDGLVAGLSASEDDCVGRIRNAWEQMKTCRLLGEPGSGFTPQEQSELLAFLERKARQIVFWTGYKTIPDRLQRWLDESRPGYIVPFHAVFEDEMPDADDRRRILDRLAWAPQALKGGVVDPERGLVYRYEAQGFKRWLSLLWIAAALLLATGLVLGTQAVLPLHAGRPGSWQAPLLGWAAVLFGVLLHAVIGTAKRVRSRTEVPDLLPVGRLVIMANAHLGVILLRVGTAFIGFLALVYSGITEVATSNAFLFNALLVGYSLDSVVELFGSGLDRRAAAQQANLGTTFSKGTQP